MDEVLQVIQQRAAAEFLYPMVVMAAHTERDGANWSIRNCLTSI